MGCWWVVLIPDASKRNISRSVTQEERPKVVMVSSSDKEPAKAGPVTDTGLGLYNPPGPQGSGINHETPTLKSFCTSTSLCLSTHCQKCILYVFL